MSDLTDIAARTQRFNEAVRAFTPPPPMRYAKLMPLKEGIVELREKGASLRLIRELLATVGVAVGTDTIARFLAEVNSESQSARTSKRPIRVRNMRCSPAQVQPAAVPSATAATTGNSRSPQPPSSNAGTTPNTDKSPERSRSRGPRIADPRNL